MYRYSTRLSWHFSPNPHSQLIQAKLQAGAPLLDLTPSNPTTVSLNYPHQEISRLYGSITDFLYQQEPSGMLGARQAVCDYYLSQHGAKIGPERVLLTASTSEAYSLLFKLLCDPGDEVLIPIPSYPLFEYLAALENVRTTPYDLRYDGSWFVDFDSLVNQISERTRAVVLVSPNNPTGSYLKQAEAAKLVEVCGRHHLPVISDEVFSDYPLNKAPGRVTTLASSTELLSFSLNGLSKIAGMPQMKLGWIVVNGPEKEAGPTREKLELLLDTYLSVGTPVQRALGGLFAIGRNIREQIVERTQINLHQAHQSLECSPAHCLHTEAGWSVIIQLPATLTEEEWTMRLLNQQDVIIQPGYFFDMISGAYLVASLLTQPEIFREGLARLRAVLA